MRKQDLFFGVGLIGLLILLLLVLTSCTTSVSQAAAPSAPSAETLLGRPPLNEEEAALTQLFLVQIEAIAKADAKLFTSVYSDDAQIKTHGWGLIGKKELTEKMVQWIGQLSEFAIKDLKIGLEDGKASATAFKSFMTKRGPRSAQYSYLLRKEKEKWLISNETFD